MISILKAISDMNKPQPEIQVPKIIVIKKVEPEQPENDLTDVPQSNVLLGAKKDVISS